MVFLSRLTKKKGLDLLLEVLRSATADIHLDIIGPDTEQGYWPHCQALVAQLPDNVSVDKQDGLPPADAFGKLISAHCFVMPTLGENFGHAIFESFLAGRPVVISDKTPWRDLENQMTGFDIPLENHQAFREAIQRFAVMDQVEWEIWARSSWKFAAAYLERENLAGESERMLNAALES